MSGASATIAPELLACIGEGRDPSSNELDRVANRIWSDVRGARSAFAWGELSEDSGDRQFILRAAHVATTGGADAPAAS